MRLTIILIVISPYGTVSKGLTGSLRDIVANVLNQDIVVSEFELQPLCYVFPWERYEFHLSLQ